MWIHKKKNQKDRNKKNGDIQNEGKHKSEKKDKVKIKEKFYGKKKYKNTQRNENPMAKKEKKNLRKYKI